MTPLLDANRAMTEAQEAFNDMRHYMHTEQYKRFVDWIDALLVQHQVSMNSCGKDDLVEKQIRIKQLIQMRRALLDPGGAYTGFTF